jgi:hypothetical protein
MADPSPKIFTEAVAAAVVEATASREELGRARAAEFTADPDRFDPRTLLVLGAPGLQAFASAFGLDLGIQTSPEPTKEVVIASSSAASGWSSEQAALIPFEGFGAGFGILAGIILICAISVLALLGR